MMTIQQCEKIAKSIHEWYREIGTFPESDVGSVASIIFQEQPETPWVRAALDDCGEKLRKLEVENAALKKSPWVSVKEKLPDFGDNVFVAGEYLLEQRCCRVGVEDVWKWTGQFSERWSSELFSHWMLIPELPDLTIEEKAMELRALILKNHPEAKELMPKEKNE